MGLCNSLMASCAYSCGCCICDCCLNKYRDSNGVIETDLMFNDELGLVIYDKMSKDTSLNPIYGNREKNFKELQIILNNHRIDNNEIDQDLVIADIGCGTGGYTEIICDTFISNNSDKLLCIDKSPKCLQFIRDKIIKKNKNLQNYDLLYICNETDSLSLPDRYITNAIDLSFMAFTLYHINKNEKILKEIFKSLKPNGIFVICEFSPDHFIEVDDKLFSTETSLDLIDKNKKYQAVSDHDEDLNILNNITSSSSTNQMFQTQQELQEFICSFGFKFEQNIKHLFDNQQWILIFRK